MFPKRVTNRNPRLHTPHGSAFNLQQTKKSASVQFHRVKSQIGKKYGKTGSDIVGSMQSEVGWLGLCLLASCLIIIVYVVLMIVSSSEHTPLSELEVHKDKMHADQADAMEHMRGIDPEHWPHHEYDKNSQKRNRNDKVPPSENNNNNHINDEIPTDKRTERQGRTDRTNRFSSDGRPPIPESERDSRYSDIEQMQNDVRSRRGRKERMRDSRDSRDSRDPRDLPPDDIIIDDPSYIERDSRERDSLDAEMDDEIGRAQRERHEENQRRSKKGRQIKVPNKEPGQIGLNSNDMVNFNSMLNDLNSINWDEIKQYSESMSNDNSLASIYDFTITAEEKAYRIKHGFLHAWHGYAKHALGHDEIQPVSDLPGDSWGGLGATLIDALDTMMLMGIKEEFTEARKKLDEIHFDIDLQVSFFETTIRHLGGLIGAHEVSELLGPKDEIYLPHAIELADHLLPAFNTETGIPKSMVNLKTGAIKNYGWTKDKSVLSEVGSNQLELYSMSHFTNSMKYFNKAKHVLRTLDDMEKEDLLYARLIDADTATFPRNEKVYTVGGMADSFYEYLLKLWILTNYQDTESLRMYIDTIDSLNEMLLRQVNDEKRRNKPYYFYGEQWYNKFRGKTEELTCFMPGVLALGSYHALLRQNEAEKNNIKLTDAEIALIERRDIHLKLAHALVESCYQLYTEMPTGLAPESIQFDNDGWEVKEPRYQLRPETIESLYIMYSITGYEMYRHWAWNIFKSIEMHCKTEVAFSGVTDVRDVPVQQDNKMESYVMAETFKYLYLLFDDYAGSLLPLNKYVFNTEAHPIKRFDLKLEEWMKNVEPNEQMYIEGFGSNNNNNNNGNSNNNNVASDSVNIDARNNQQQVQ